MNKKQLIITLFVVSTLFTSPAGAQDVSKKAGELYLDYKGKQYVVMQYDEGWGVFRFYSLQYWPSIEKNELPEALVLILDKNGKVVKEIPGADVYSAYMVLYDINADLMQDLVLFWRAGAHSTYVEVWMNKDYKDFKKVFEEFNDKNIFFTIRDGIPTIASKKEYPMSATNDNFPDSDYDFYKWNGKTFALKAK